MCYFSKSQNVQKCYFLGPLGHPLDPLDLTPSWQSDIRACPCMFYGFPKSYSCVLNLLFYQILFSKSILKVPKSTENSTFHLQFTKFLVILLNFRLLRTDGFRLPSPFHFSPVQEATRFSPSHSLA